MFEIVGLSFERCLSNWDKRIVSIFKCQIELSVFVLCFQSNNKNQLHQPIESSFQITIQNSLWSVAFRESCSYNWKMQLELSILTLNVWYVLCLKFKLLLLELNGMKSSISCDLHTHSNLRNYSPIIVINKTCPQVSIVLNHWLFTSLWPKIVVHLWKCNYSIENYLIVSSCHWFGF